MPNVINFSSCSSYVYLPVFCRVIICQPRRIASHEVEHYSVLFYPHLSTPNPYLSIPIHTYQHVGVLLSSCSFLFVSISTRKGERGGANEQRIVPSWPGGFYAIKKPKALHSVAQQTYYFLHFALCFFFLRSKGLFPVQVWP
jgi:hypothetical protein